jgi:uncharacterized protein with von Willebrand factor type A (vWA) domain
LTDAAPSAPTGRKRFEPGRFATNIMHFARTLRAAGMPVGPGKVLDAIRAVEAVGLERRSDFYWTLHAVFVNRRDQRELFDQAFHIFWRKPDLLEKAMQLLLPQIEAPGAAAPQEIARRLAEALARLWRWCGLLQDQRFRSEGVRFRHLSRHRPPGKGWPACRSDHEPQKRPELPPTA